MLSKCFNAIKCHQLHILDSRLDFVQACLRLRMLWEGSHLEAREPRCLTFESWVTLTQLSTFDSDVEFHEVIWNYLGLSAMRLRNLRLGRVVNSCEAFFASLPNAQDFCTIFVFSMSWIDLVSIPKLRLTCLWKPQALP